MDNARFGQTQFQERLTFQRGLEGELARSIARWRAVQAARVHLALPNQNGFFREQQKPTRLGAADPAPGPHARPRADRRHRAPGVEQRARAQPEGGERARPDRRAAVGRREPSSGQGLDAQQLQYVQQIEASYVKRILEILEPVVGRDNLRANVTADIDFSQTEATSEEFKPNQGSDGRCRAQPAEFSEPSSGAQAAAQRRAGRAINQPPVPATAPIDGAAAAAAGSAAAACGGGSTRRDAVTNYEVDKTVRVTRNATGTVKRLNAAVVVNHRVTTDAKGKTTSTPLTGDEIEKLTALVQESIGFTKERGDSVKVINAPFRVETRAQGRPTCRCGSSRGCSTCCAPRAAPAALALVALLVVFGLVRPALKAALPRPAATGRGSWTLVADDAVPLPAAGRSRGAGARPPRN